jgi:hypothetical protein
MTELQQIYFASHNNLLQMREKSFSDRRSLLQRQIKDNLANIIKLFNSNTDIIGKISDRIKSIINIDESFNTPNMIIPEFEDINEIKNINNDELNNIARDEINKIRDNSNFNETLNKLLSIYINLISNYNFIHKIRSIVNYLKSRRNKSLRFAEPKDFDKKKFIQNNVDGILSKLNNINK